MTSSLPRTSLYKPCLQSVKHVIQFTNGKSNKLLAVNNESTNVILVN